MKIAIIGYGSIGKRHAEVALKLEQEVSVVSRRRNITNNCYNTIENVLSEFLPDLIIVANETSSHLSTVTELEGFGYRGKLLVEKPLYLNVNNIKIEKSDQIFVAYNLRFHPIVQQLKKLLINQKLITAHFYTGSYLPMWRDNREYTESYSASKKMGGGVLRDLSHELDLSLYLLGRWRRLSALGGQFSTLKIDSDDNYSIIYETNFCPNVQVNINYLNREPKRQIIINTEEYTLEADLIKNTLAINGKKSDYEYNYNDSYKNQLLDVLGPCSIVANYNEGYSIVKMINQIELSGAQQVWVNNT